jgi:crotonobetainyl-CoA:carnitine CoA-transferase CaiB-like acyl-CoA transferase
MADPRAAALGDLSDWWFDGGKTTVDVDLDVPGGQEAVRNLAAHADLVMDSAPAGVLAARGLDFADLSASRPTLVQVSLTPFGRTGPRALWRSSDLVAAAMGGVCSLTGPPEKPLNSWGQQNYAFGGFMAAICGLSGVHAARETGRGAHVDLSLHEVVASSLENLFFQ